MKDINTVKKRGMLRDLFRRLLPLMLLGLFFLAMRPQTVYAIDHLEDILNLKNYKEWKIKPKTESVDNENWRVKLSNASCAIPIHVDIGLIVGQNKHIEASVDLCTTTDFEIEFKKANWYSTTVDSDVKKSFRLYKMETFDTTTLNNLIGLIPYVGNVAGVTFKKEIVGAATQPCIVKGKMSVKAVYKVSWDRGATADYESVFQITSIEPLDQGTNEVTAFVGDHETMDSGFGKISLSIGRFDIVELGPIIQGKAGIFAGDIATWRLNKDQWDADESRDDLADVLHTCCERGKKGCLTGNSRIVQQTWYDWRIQARAEFFGYDIINFGKDVGGDEDYLKKDKLPIRQSLTWDEEVVYSADPCPHQVYRVPVGVWVNQAKTIGVNGVTVKPAEEVQTDENVRKFTQDVSGSRGQSDGMATLFLPYKEGKYTIEAAGLEAKGSAEQPSDMVRGRNDRVDIIVRPNETRTLSVRKEWDIDYENKDKPDSIEVLLQAQYYTKGKNWWQSAVGKTVNAIKWEPVQLVTLNSANNWQASFDPVPRYEIIDPSAEIPVYKEIRYRIRELKPENSVEAAVTGAVFDAGDNGRILFPEDEEEEWPAIEPDPEPVLPAPAQENPDQEKLRKAGSRVVHKRFDLDNTNVFGVIKDTLTSWDSYWQIDPNAEKYLLTLAKKAFFPLPTVTYKVPGYTSSVGEKINDHITKYVVEYKEEGETTVIKNTACMDVAIYKRWLDFDDEKDIPDSVWLVLQNRVKEKYLELAGEAGAHMPYTPVIKPLYGNMTNLASLVGLDLVAKLDFAGLLNLPIAIGKAKENDNPLISYRLKYGVRKYDPLMKLPLDFEAGEVTSEIIKMVIKAVTGFDFPISISFTGGGYVTIPGKAFHFFKDWELTSNVINVMADIDVDADPAIGGTKYWKNDDPEKRPEYITIVVKDGETEIGRVKVEGDTQSGSNDSWVWALKQSDLSQGGSGEEGSTPELDPSKNYTITEEFPEDYEYKDCYIASIDGYDITNTFSPSARVVIEKQYEGEGEKAAVTVKLTDDKGEEVGTYVLNEENNFRVTLVSRAASGNEQEEDTQGGSAGEEGGTAGPDSEDAFSVSLSGHDINAFRVEETEYDDETYVPAYAGPVQTEDEEGNAVYTFTVTNRPRRNVKVHVEKTWAGDTEKDRPAGVSVTLKRNGEEIASATLDASADWKADIEKDNEGRDLPETDEQGARYLYTLEEEAQENYKSTVRSSESEGEITFSVTNQWTGGEDKVTVRGRKTWIDDNNADGLRPEEIHISLSSSDGSVKRTESVPSGDGSWEFTNLPRYAEDGSALQYSVIEEEVEGYITSYASPVFDGESRTWTCNITNTHGANSTEVTVHKVWDDNDDIREIRPDSVKVMLYGSTEGSENRRKVAEAELSGDNDWSYTFTGLKRYDKPGIEIVYTVEEETPANYKSRVTGSQTEGFTITNTADDTMQTLEVIKVWNDAENHNNTRPETVTIRLLQDGEEYRTAKLSEENGWKYTFNEAPLVHKDEKGYTAFYTYDVKEDEVPGYTTEINHGGAYAGARDFTVTFTNTLGEEIERMDIDVTKQWQDDENAAAIRPSGIRVHLMDGENEIRSLTLSESENWSGTIENVPVYRSDGSTRIEYTLREEPVSGYLSEVSGNADEGFTVTNTLHETAQFEVRKIWIDEESMDRPSSVCVRLLKNGEEYKEAVLSEDGGWKYVFTGLPLTENGERIAYSVTEDPVPNYDSEISEITSTQSQGVTTYHADITNRRKAQINACFVAEKKWLNADNTENPWPEGETCVIRLYKEGEEIGQAELSASAPTYTFEGLSATNEKGSWIAYTAVEDELAGYELLSDSFTSRTREDGTIEYRYVVTNRAASPRIDIPVTKIWNDDNSPSRPDSVSIHLRANGTDVPGSPVTLSEANGWAFTFRDLPVYQEGAEIEYSVSEDGLGIPNYNVTYTPGTQRATGYEAAEGFTVTNTWNYFKEPITITKVWDEPPYYSMNNSFRPAKIRVYLTVKGERTDKYIDITGSNVAKRWEGTFAAEDLDDHVYYDGIEEEPVPGYKASYAHARGTYKFTVTNTAEIVRYTLKKQWKYADGTDMDVSGRVLVMLMNGDTPVNACVLSGAKTSDVVVPLLLDEEGEEILYSIEETDVPAKHTMTYTLEPDSLKLSDSAYVKKAYLCTITNTRDTISYKVTKKWRVPDSSVIPENVLIWLWVDGVESESLRLRERTGWEDEFKRLDRTRYDGTEIEYEAREMEIEGFITTYEDIKDEEGRTIGRAFTNIWRDLKVPVSGSKTWEDNGNALGLRPESITIRLMRDDEEIEARTVTAEDDWKWDFGELPAVDESGKDYVYTVREDPVPYYTSAADGMNVTNTLEIETVNVTVAKEWNDADNVLGLRPEFVTIHLKGEDGTGTVVSESTQLRESNEWSAVFGNLLKYGSDGTQIRYTVEEEPVSGYSGVVRSNGGYSFTITNTPSCDVRAVKEWVDTPEDKKPASLEVFLYENDWLKDRRTLGAGNEWSCVFENLPMLDENGGQIRYTVSEAYLDSFRGEVSETNLSMGASGHMEKAFILRNTPYVPVSFELPIRKEITGEPAEAENFRFTLTPVEDQENALSTVITGSGSGSFSLSFDREGVFLYTLAENAGSNPEYDYDTRERTVRIEVRADENGTLRITDWLVDREHTDSAVFTNRYQSQTTEVNGRKIWEDDNDALEKRPESIVIRLFADEEEVDSRTVTDENGWRWSFTELPKNKEDGTPVVYSVKEDPVELYEASVSGYDVVNTLTAPSEEAQITVIKEWDETDMPVKPDSPAGSEDAGGAGSPAGSEDAGGSDSPAGDGGASQDGGEEEPEWPKRPETVMIHVYNGSTLMAEAPLSEENGWQYTFTELPYRDESGDRIPYIVTEDFVEGYDTVIGPVEEPDPEQEGVYICNILNKWTGNKTDVPTVTKKVKETNDRDGSVSEWQDGADYDIGDSIPYRITGTLPTRFEKYEQFTVYTFRDRLSDGLTPPEAESISVTKNGVIDLKHRFDVTIEGRIITIGLKSGEDMRLWEGEEAMTARDRIIIEYHAVLNENAVTGSAGNPNDVDLTYTIENDGVYSEETSVKDKVIVFTYTVEANKVVKEDGEMKPLEGAGFTLYKKVRNIDAGNDDLESEEYEWIKVGEEITGVTTFTFRGVDAGNYRLEETTVPAGYHRVSPVEFTVIAYYDTDFDDPGLKVLSVAPAKGIFSAETIPAGDRGDHVITDGIIRGDIENTKGLNLPNTGGPGTRGIHTAGLLTLLAAAVLLLEERMRRKTR